MQNIGPVGEEAVHVCIDMQYLFAGHTAWRTLSMPTIVPNILRLVRLRPERTVFTRFVTPYMAEDAVGHWQTYYRRWSSLTTNEMDPAMLDVMAELRSFSPPARIVHKRTYSAFEAPAFSHVLEYLDCQTVICSGVETDVCVLATVLSAMDRGYRVIVVSDACTSSDLASHYVTLKYLYPRFEDQIEIGTTDELVANWSV